MAETSFKVEGMTCQHCVMAVKKAVEGINGVSSAEVEIGSAKVSYDEGSTNRDAIAAAITKAGYKAA